MALLLCTHEISASKEYLKNRQIIFRYSIQHIQLYCLKFSLKSVDISKSCARQHKVLSFLVIHYQHVKLDFLAAAEYLNPPNFCCCRKSAGKITAAINAAEFVKFHQLPQKLRLTFGWVYHFTKPRIIYFAYWLQAEKSGFICEMLVLSGNHGLDRPYIWLFDKRDMAQKSSTKVTVVTFIYFLL